MKTSLADILSQHSVWRGGALAPGPGRTVPTGFAALDRELPGAGWPRGALTEILGQREGVGELQLVLPALAALSASGRRVVWLAPPHLPSAPALAAAEVLAYAYPVLTPPVAAHEPFVVPWMAAYVHPLTFASKPGFVVAPLWSGTWIVCSLRISGVVAEGYVFRYVPWTVVA